MWVTQYIEYNGRMTSVEDVLKMKTEKGVKKEVIKTPTEKPVIETPVMEKKEVIKTPSK